MKDKKLFPILLLLVFGFNYFAQSQPNVRTSAWNYYKERQFAKAKEAIDKASTHELTATDPKTWYFKALIYLSIASSNDSVLRSSTADPITETFEAVKKSREFDAKKAFYTDNNAVLKELTLLLYNDGTDKYNLGVINLTTNPSLSNLNFNKALTRFQQFIESFAMMGKDSMGVVLELARYQVDAKNVYYYAGNCAYQTGQKDKAVSFYQGLVNAKFQGFEVYANLADIYFERGDTTRAFTVIDKGKKVNTDKNVLKNLDLKELQIYQLAGKMDELKNKLEAALNEDPNNITFLVTLGETYYTISEKLAEEKKTAEADEYWNKAMNLFLKSLEKTTDADKEMRFLLNNKIGTIYYNKGADYYNQAIDKANESREKELKDLYSKYFDMAIPYLEKSMELNPADKAAIPLLIKIYLLKGDMKKVTELNKLK
ncbi:MAG: tetratricopeptide repeat protein [Sphingobacteriales bacterium]|nr:tetratricopeptide repeat protein [Sphingobacteriales bacterium]